MEAKPEDVFDKQPDWRKIVLFNGPPRSGKSFGAACVAHFVRENMPWTQPRILDFAEPLKKAAHALYCAFHPWGYYDMPEAEHLKGLASGDFLGLSPREAYIALSEEYMKVKHGEEVMGFLMRKRMLKEKATQVFIIPNNGFLPELEPLVNFVGQRNVLIIEVHVAGKTFDGDSRDYVGDAAKEKYPHINVIKLPNVFGNKDDRDLYKMLCQGAVKKFLKIEERV